METMRVTPGLKRADVVHDYVVHLVFSDGLEADVDLSYVLELGPVFEILRDPVEFRQVRVSSAANTVTWPNGADIAPESFYELAKEAAAVAS